MIAKRGQFDFCDSPVINSAQLVQGNYQAPYFYNQLTDAYLNVKNYNFTLNVVQDALDADIQILNAMAESLAGAAVGAGGALFGLGIGLSEFLLSSASRITRLAEVMLASKKTFISSVFQILFLFVAKFRRQIFNNCRLVFQI